MKKKAAKKKAEPLLCENCGEPIDPKFGVATCSDCGNEKCVEFCIPGGNRTLCLDCEDSN